MVVANHFKSKGCRDASGADADHNDNQGCWNATRATSAQQLHAWLQTDPTGTGAGDAVLLGDFNAYAMEDPIRTLRDLGCGGSRANGRRLQRRTAVSTTPC